MEFPLLAPRGRRSCSLSRRRQRLSRRRRTRARGIRAPGLGYHRCGSGCSSVDRSRRGRWSGWRFGAPLRWDMGEGGIPVDGIVS